MGADDQPHPQLVEIEQGKSSATGTADVTVATFQVRSCRALRSSDMSLLTRTRMQTLAYNDFSRLEKFVPESHKAVIIDEAHHAAAPTYIEILSRFDPEVETALVSTRADSDGETLEAMAIERREDVEGGWAVEAEAPTQEDEQEVVDNPDAVDDFLPQEDASFKASSSTDTGSGYVDEPPPLPMLLDSLGRARVPLLAFTATWGRADGLALGKVFEKIVWHADWLDMVRGKWCVRAASPKSVQAPFAETCTDFVGACFFRTGSPISNSPPSKSTFRRSTSTRSKSLRRLATSTWRAWRGRSIPTSLRQLPSMHGSRRLRVSRQGQPALGPFARTAQD